MLDQKRIIVYTSGGANAERLALLQSLCNDPEIKIIAIVQDNFRLFGLKKIKFLFQKWGAFEFTRSVSFQMARTFFRKVFSSFEAWHNIFVPIQHNHSYMKFCKLHSIELWKVKDINLKDNTDRLKAYKAELGIILGGRILKQHVLMAPKKGTLNIHKHDARAFRGGSQLGFIEKFKGESKICVTIHFAVSKVDAGDILELECIPIEKYDTNESLSIKAGLLGNKLYLKAIKDTLSGQEVRVPQDLSKGATYYTSPYWPRYRLWSKVKKQQLQAINKESPRGPSRKAKKIFFYIRQLYFYLALPLLARKRRNLEKHGKAPIIIFYYHGIGNSMENWMMLPIETLWKQMEYAKKYFKIISLGEAVEKLKSGRNDKTSVVFTFDDGYRSCFTQLKPLLETYKVPATFFVCSESAKHQVSHRHDFDKGYHDVQLMTSQQILESYNSGIEIGSHAENHENMASLSDENCERVLLGSKNSIENIINNEVLFFSYPFGSMKHLSNFSINEARKHYSAVFSAYGGYNIPDKEDFHYQRIANPVELASFKAIVNGVHRFKPYYMCRPKKFNS